MIPDRHKARKALKIVTWNCAMGIQKKREQLLRLAADVIVLQECSKKSLKDFNRGDGWSTAWFGKNKHKGLGVLVRVPWNICEKTLMTPKWAARLVIDGPISIELFPVWACRGERPGEHYIGQVHRLLDLMEQNRISPFAIVAGDFNSNAIWDGQHEINSHSDAVARLRNLGFHSAYHEFFRRAHGQEPHPTLWFRKKKSATYHIDYAFLSRRLLSKLTRVTVGHHRRWLAFSDHAPVLIELDLHPRLQASSIWLFKTLVFIYAYVIMHSSEAARLCPHLARGIETSKFWRLKNAKLRALNYLRTLLSNSTTYRPCIQ